MFARKASLSFRGLQLMEEQEHNIRLSSLCKVAAALNLPAIGLHQLITQFLEQSEDSIIIASLRIQQDGIRSWPLHVFNFVDAFRANPEESRIQSPPIQELDPKLRALLASTVETLCADLHVRIPEWCFGVPILSDPWFVSEIESLKPMALLESPVRFRKRNIFVLQNFLNRA